MDPVQVDTRVRPRVCTNKRQTEKHNCVRVPRTYTYERSYVRTYEYCNTYVYSSSNVFAVVYSTLHTTSVQSAHAAHNNNQSIHPMVFLLADYRCCQSIKLFLQDFTGDMHGRGVLVSRVALASRDWAATLARRWGYLAVRCVSGQQRRTQRRDDDEAGAATPLKVTEQAGRVQTQLETSWRCVLFSSSSCVALVVVGGASAALLLFLLWVTGLFYTSSAPLLAPKST